MPAISLAVAGAAGRMGKRLIALAAEDPAVFQVVAAIDAPNSPALGQDSGALAGVAPIGVAVTSALAGKPDMLIDFSAPQATRALLAICVERRIPAVIGTTGLTAADQNLIENAAQFIPILQATNTSLGVTVLLAIAAQVARQLGDGYDIEIVEAHHNQKKDAPSGTALSLAQSVCNATGRDIEKDLAYGRHGPDALRKKNTVGMHSLRMADVVGEHTVYFATPGERIELKHVATTRDTFAKGALRAAQFLASQKPGRYTMNDVLGI